jgi:hypothetical protein
MMIDNVKNKKYLLYFDILGFDKLTKDIEANIGIKSSKIRLDFIDVISRQVESIEKQHLLFGKKYGNSDDWILVCDNLDNVLRSLLILLNHDTGYLASQKIPLEIAIGIAEYDVFSKLEGKNLVAEDDTINFLKTKIIDHYHQWFRKQNHGESPKETYVVCTESAYNSEVVPIVRTARGLN